MAEGLALVRVTTRGPVLTSFVMSHGLGHGERAGVGSDGRRISVGNEGGRGGGGSWGPRTRLEAGLQRTTYIVNGATEQLLSAFS